MYKTGTDIEKTERIKDAFEKIKNRVYTDGELAYIESRGAGKFQTATGIFCAKEAFSKAIGTGITGFSLKDVEVGHSSHGRPYFSFSGKLSHFSADRFSLSISHTEDIATATVIFDGVFFPPEKRKYVLTSQMMKNADKAAAKALGSSLALMENAAKALCDCCLSFNKNSFVVLCGGGNNGGDGICLSSLLAKKGKRVTVILLSETQSRDSEYYLEKLEKSVEKFVFSPETEEKAKELLSQSDVAVDCLFGTGFHGSLPENAKKLLSYINIPTVACDLPSGISSDTGEVAAGAHKACKTVTFAAKKPCHFLFPAKDLCGDITVADIGISDEIIKENGVFAEIITEKTVSAFVPERPENSNKGTFGTLLSVCGSENMPGAALLALRGAMSSGVGLCIAKSPEKVKNILCTAVPEAIYGETSRNPSAILVGCGLTKDKEAVMSVIDRGLPTLFDADAINVIAENGDILKKHTAEKIMTPHPAEMARLIGKDVEYIEKHRFEVASSYAKKNNTVLLLKGRYTVIAIPDGRLFVSEDGNSGLSKGGSGDVLSGFIAGLLASGFSAAGAAVCGVFCQGRAAEYLLCEKGVRGFTPTDVAGLLGKFIPDNKK